MSELELDVREDEVLFSLSRLFSALILSQLFTSLSAVATLVHARNLK